MQRKHDSADQQAVFVPEVNFGHLATRAESSIESIDAENPNHQTQEKEAQGQSESRCYSSGRIGSALPFH